MFFDHLPLYIFRPSLPSKFDHLFDLEISIFCPSISVYLFGVRSTWMKFGKKATGVYDKLREKENKNELGLVMVNLFDLYNSASNVQITLIFFYCPMLK